MFHIAILTHPEQPPYILNIQRTTTVADVASRIEAELVAPVVGIRVEGEEEVVTEARLETMKGVTGQTVRVGLVFPA